MELGTKIEIKSIHLEIDRNGKPRPIFTDEDNIEWSLSEESTVSGFMTCLVKKSECYFFPKP